MYEATTPAPELTGRVIFDQQWTDVAFLHWAVEPASVAHLFPRGTRPDVWEGATYVGLIPFRMRRAGPGRGVPVPYFGTFLETNVRLYSIDDDGRHGVVFRSLECQRLAVVLAARVIGFPYTWAAMSRSPSSYRTRRRWPRPPVAGLITLQPGPAVKPTALEEFLTARWGAHSRRVGVTLFTPNHHEAWPLHEAVVAGLSDQLVAAAGVTVSGPPSLRALWSPGVHSRFGAPIRVT